MDDDRLIIDIEFAIDDDLDDKGLKTLAANLNNALARAGSAGGEAFRKNFEDKVERIQRDITGLSEQMTKIFDMPDKPYRNIENAIARIAEIQKEVAANNKAFSEAGNSVRSINKELEKSQENVLVKASEITDENKRHAEALKAINSQEKISSRERALQIAKENDAHRTKMELLKTNLEGAKQEVKIWKEQRDAARESVRQINASQKALYQEEKEQEALIATTKERLSTEEGIAELTEELQEKADAVSTEYNKQGQEIKNNAEALTDTINKESELLELVKQGTNNIKLQDELKQYSQNRTDSEISRIQAEIRAKQEEIQAKRRDAAQWYYLLRAVKMAKFAIDNINKSLDKFINTSVKGIGKVTKLWFKLATPFGILGKAIKGANNSLKSFNKESKRTTKSHDGFVESMKHGVWTIIKYTFGIRSLYFLFNKLRRALSTGMENLATQYDHVNQQMSSVVSSLERMKNAVAAMVQPLLNVLAPALEKISELFANLAYNVASFFATLTGQDFVYYAKRIKKGYIEDKKAAKDYNDEVDRQLSNLDKLNVLTSPKDKKKEEEESPVPDMFDIRPVAAKAKDWLKKLKDFLKPITNAWAKEGQFVIDSWKYAWQEMVKLAKDIWRDFLKVWFEPETERIFENVFHIIGDIGLVVGNLAKNFRKAWNFDNNGYRILKAMRDIILSITERLREAADYTVKWSEKLNFIPLMTTLAGVLENQVVPAVDKVMALLVKLYEEVFLELVRYVIEDLGPIITRIFGNLVETVGNLAENFRIVWSECGLGRKIVEKIETIITDIARAIEDATKDTKEWAKNLNFRPLLRSTYELLDKMEPVIKWIVDTLRKFWRDVLLPISKDFIEKDLPKIMDLISKILGELDLDMLSNTTDSFFTLIRTFWDKYGDIMLSIVTKIADKLVELVNSGTLDRIIQGITDFISGLDPDEVADFVLQIGGIIVQLKLLLPVLSKISGSVINIMSMVNVVKQLGMYKDVGKITKGITDLKSEISLLKPATEPAVDGLQQILDDALGLGGPETLKGPSLLAKALASPAAAALGTVAAIGLMVAAIITLWHTNEEFKSKVISMWEEIKATFNEASQKIVDSINEVIVLLDGVPIEKLSDLWLWVCNNVAPTLLAIFEKVKIAIQVIVLEITGVIELLSAGLSLLINIVKLVGGAIGLLQGKTELWKSAVDGLFDSLKRGEQGWKDIGKGMLGVVDLKNSSNLLELADAVDQNNSAQKDLSKSLNDTEQKEQSLAESSQNMAKNLDTASGSAENMSQAFSNMPSSMSPELAQSITDMNAQLETMNTSLGGMDMSGFENMNTQLENVDANLEGIDMSGFINSMNTEIPEATSTAEASISELSTTAAQLEPEMTEAGKNVSSGFTTGMALELASAIPMISGKFGLIISIVQGIFQEHSPSVVFLNIGKNVVQGFINGVLSLMGNAVSAIRSVANSVINAARAALSPSKLVSIGKNLLSGLASGIRSGVSNAVTAIQGAANTVINAAKSRFQTHSPSKIFEDIGKMLDEGLAVGVDKNTDDVTDAFDNMVPDNQFLELFYEKFTGMLSSLREESVSIVESMIDEIESAIARMDNLAMLESLSTQLSNISSIKIPDIAVGAKVPDNEKFAQTQTVDLSSLPKMLKSAFIEAFAETSNLQTSDSGDIIVEMNGYELLRAVRDENTKYKKQTGRSAFA